MSNNITKVLFLAFGLILAVCTAACGVIEEENAGTTYDIYYVNNEETKIFSNPYRTETEDGQALLEELIGQLSMISEKWNIGRHCQEISNCWIILGTGNSLR